jgi:lipid II:glycine glycyltransferase (peptidoglycan interpeptide bridge formation enzyme)
LVAHAQYIANLAEYSNLCPVNLLVFEVMSWAKTEGCRFLNLGTGNEDGGKTINLGLFDFKESFGGRGVLRESMHLNLEIEKK